MNAEQLLQHFERISEAPNAIPRLRRFILDLAVRGKLVEQDPSDEPASELLKRIAAEKARLVKAREIKNEKPLAPIEDADFYLPKSWTWTRLGKVTSYIQRGKSPKYAVNDGSLVVSQKCVQWSGLDLKVAKRITLESLMDYEKIRFLRDGDLLWNSTGTGTIGRIIKAVDPPAKLVCDSHVTVVRCLAVVPEYIRAWLRSDHIYALIEDRAAGSTNQVELTAQMAINQVVPLPPLAEQHRIVARVDDLMSLCDQLEAAKAEREKCRDSLVAASLQGLNQPAEEEETFREHARFTFNNLPRITTRAAHIKQLRQTIVNLAVRGKLVEQDLSDEAATELLRRIATERAKNSLKRKARLSKQEPRHDSAGHFEQLPSGWEQARFCEIASIESNLVNPSSYKDMPHVAPDNIESWSARLLPYSTVGEAGVFSAKHHFFAGAILYSKIRPNLAKVVKVDFDGLCSADMYPVHPFIDRDFLVTYMISKLFVSQAIAGDNRVAMPKINQIALSAILVPVPPLAEQRRIVAKVDELMAICDQLEVQITATEQDSRRFLESVLADALAPGIDLSAEAEVT